MKKKKEIEYRVLTGIPSFIEKELNRIKEDWYVIIQGVSGDTDKTIVVVELIEK